METITLYLLKSAALFTLFYLTYVSLLRKETFFKANRWFLLSGLLTAVLLPFVTFTKTIWVNPSPAVSMDNTVLSIPNESVEINWTEAYLFPALLLTYGLVVIFLLIKLAREFYSLRQLFKNKTIQRQGKFKFINTSENIAPFSFFDFIVYNSNLYNEIELHSIIEHEKIHSEQKHTIDVLISRLFCILFWFNPIIWLYKKAIIQNLEFIADNDATKKIADKKAYQYTLLKITTHQNCVAITNHFYQSLIKKRIVMLNKNQSKKQNYLKYTLVIPALIAFMLLFQVEVIAQEKAVTENKSVSKTNDEHNQGIFTINKNTSENQLKYISSKLKEDYNVSAKFSDTKRNETNELTAIKVDLKKGKEVNKVMQTKSSEPIKNFQILVNKDENGAFKLDLQTMPEVAKTKTIKIVTTKTKNDSVTKKEIFINGEKVTEQEMNELDPQLIESINVIRNSDKPSINIYTKGNYGSTDSNKKIFRVKTIQQNGSNFPTPPVPPTAPKMVIKTPAIPEAPQAPKKMPNESNQNEWLNFEKKMEQYEAQLKKIEPDMSQFELQMKKYEEKMKLYEKKMEEYGKKIEAYYSKTK
ncbi:M56 family metallopeptidase [Flavobacterium agrisoli]|uniref:M56 family metallopeptidase n=1 Tax=Flavobacterium agrisoli TaxID=2793066 RepID=A0A934UIW9_9FLAO|nr:M56 family metallopeptidase [Flavobacterium agrisoli]MBK0368999.1 M56 family metallopeptidase [Flavobacterium agrisoli]